MAEGDLERSKNLVLEWLADRDAEEEVVVGIVILGSDEDEGGGRIG